MKIIIEIKKYFTHLGLIISVVGFFIFPMHSFSQGQGPEKNKISSKKATRTFYGLASYYSNKFNGRRTATGEIFSQRKLTCACNVLPFGTWVKVTNQRNNRSVVVKVNDRIHPQVRRLVDLSKAAAEKLGFISRGLTRVKVEIVEH